MLLEANISSIDRFNILLGECPLPIYLFLDIKIFYIDIFHPHPLQIIVIR